MATITTAGSGNWSSTTPNAPWSSGVAPVLGDKVIIAATHTVTVDGSYSVGDDTSTGCQINGTLKASRVASSQLTVRGDVFIGATGTLDYGTEADPIPAAYTAVLIINDSATQANNKWGIRTDETSNTWAGFRLWGASKTALTTMAAALSTDTTFTMADVTGWQIGDILCFDASVAEGSASGQRYRAITGIAGNNITVGASLSYASQTNRKVANLTRNVRVYGQTGNTYKSHISLRISSGFTTTNAIEIGPAEIRLTGGHATNTHQFGGINFNWVSSSNLTAVVKKVDGIVVHDIWSVSGSTVTSVANGSALISNFGHQAYNFTISNALLSSNNNMSAVQLYNGGSVTYSNITAMRNSVAFTTGYSQGAVECFVNGGYISGGSSALLSGTGISIYFTGVTFDFQRQYNSGGQSAYGKQIFTNCTFGSQLAFIVPTNPVSYPNGAQVPSFLDSCTFLSIPVVSRASSNSQNIKSGSYFWMRNANNDPTIQFKYTYAGEQKRDNSVINRGTSSMRGDCWYSTIPTSITRKIGVSANQSITVVGYLRFNTTYGTATPPSVDISGLGATTVSFTAPATADTWHKFTLNITNPQSYAGEFTLTATGTSAANSTGAYFYIDGVLFDDFVTSVRHYGYVFDGLVYRTVDSNITQSNEATVSGYTEIDTLDKLYDRLKLWACENPTLNEFYTINGSEIDFGSTPIVIDATAAQALLYSGGTLTLKAPTLASGTKFISFVTTGTVTKSNGAVISSLYTSSAGPSARLVINLPQASMAVGVFDNTSTTVIYSNPVSGVFTLNIDPGATGTWKWAVNKQGYTFAAGSFIPGLGGEFNITPSCPQVLTADGAAMYQGTTNALVQVTAAVGTSYIDIGNGTPTLQSIYDEVEDALMTENGLKRISSGSDGVSIFNSPGGDYLFMTSGWRLRRWLAGDSNATVPAFAQSVDGTPVDEVNGPVRYLTSDTPTAVAAAVWAYASRLLTSAAIVRTELTPELANMDAAVSTRLATASYTAPDNASITAIKVKTDNLPADPASNTQVNTRLATASYTAPDNTSITAIKSKTDNLPIDPADESLLEAAIAAIPTAPSAVAVASQVRTELTVELARIDVATSTRNSVAPDNTSIAAIKAKTDNLPVDPASNTQVNTRLATSGYTAPDNASITAIKSKTDNLPVDPADESLLEAAIAAIPAAPSAVTVASQVRTELTTELARIDVATSTRNAVAPDNTSITAIKAKTDNLPVDPASSTNVAAVFSIALEGTYTAGDLIKLQSSVLLGKSSGHPETPVFRDVNDTVNRVSGTVDVDGNRSAVVLNP